MQNRRVLVTGGSGFIGSHLVKKLLQSGAQVAVTVRYASLIKNIRLSDCWNCITVIEADLRNRGALKAIRRFDPEVIFHLAAYHHVGESFHQVEECFDVNAKGTANLFDVCEGAGKFVYIATSEVYGLQLSAPFTEEMQPNPLSPYAVTKYAGEMYCRMKQRLAPGSVVILRPFNAFGPYQSTRAIIPELIMKCLRGDPIQITPGEQTRDFNFVANLTEGMIAAAEHPEPLDGPINLASGDEISIRDLARRIADLTESRSRVEIGALPYRRNEIWRMSGNATRASQLLGWEPRVGFDAGLRITVDWFRDQIARLNPAICAT
ncbi:MAG TPA: GDP-mannose 4,6-dehydratase [Bryobacteraceae bacterium]|nr:GDP-mannose 4,6-dehydratase [Bryobacteraceae bacterium]